MVEALNTIQNRVSEYIIFPTWSNIELWF